MPARMFSDSLTEQSRTALLESVVQSKVRKKTKTKTEFPMIWIIVQIPRSEKV